MYMISKEIDLAIIGGGPAGLAAAIAAKRAGIREPIIIERNNTLGGILAQCIHDGFGLELFKESLTGPEYMERYIQQVEELGIQYMLKSTVTELTADKELTVVNGEGVHKLKASSVILAMGCREQTRGALGIPGSRPAGIYTAGAAQYFMNIRNYFVGKRVVILGSGDIGLIMARRLTLEGVKVLAVIERLPYPSGLPRNIVQCLEDYNIPLMLSHTVTKINGEQRVSGVVIARVDHNYQPIPRTEIKIDCDTLILSVGLIPENELSRSAGIILDEHTGGPLVNNNFETNIPGIFASGNVLHVHDIVDWVSNEAAQAGEFAAKYIKENGNGSSAQPKNYLKILPGAGVRYVLPQQLQKDVDGAIYLRVTEPASDIYLSILEDGEPIKRFKKRKVHPAIMVKLDISGNELPANGTKELVVELQEV
jgi:thioredoxin reductase